MQVDDQIPDLSQPKQPTVIYNAAPINGDGSSDKKDGQKSYSTRKRRSAPRRYSPAPSWERWESWKDSAAFSDGKKSETANLPEVLNHINGNKKETSLPWDSSPAMLSYDGMETTNSKMTTLLPEKKIRKMSLSPAPSGVKKPPATVDPKKTKDRSPTSAAAVPKRPRGRPPTSVATDPKKRKGRPATSVATNPKKPRGRTPIPAATDPKIHISTPSTTPDTDPKKTMSTSPTPADSDPKKTKSTSPIPAATDSESRHPTPADTDPKKNKSTFPTRADLDLKKTKSTSPTPAATDPEKTESTPPTPAETDLEKTKSTSPTSEDSDPKKTQSTSPTPAATDAEKAESTPPTPADTDPKKTKSPSPTPATTDPKKPVRGGPKGSNNKKSKLKEKPKAGSKRKYCKRALDVKEKKVYGTRTKRSAPKRFSPTDLSDRKMMLYFEEFNIVSRTRRRTRTTDISEWISVKWAHVLNRNPYVLLERYVPPPSPLPHDKEEFGPEDEFGSEGCGSRCCTPTPSWMDEEEMAAYYNSEMQLDIGRCSPTASSDDTPLTPDRYVLEYDRTSCFPVLNDVAIATTIDKDQEKSSPILSLHDTAICTRTALVDEFDTCSPIPPLDVSSILTSLEDELVGTVEKDRLIPVPAHGETAIGTAEKNMLNPVPSIGEATIGSTDNVLSSVPSQNEFTIRTTESNKLSPVPSAGEASLGTSEKKTGPVPSLDEASVGTIENRLSPVSSVDEVAIDTTEKDRFDRNSPVGTTVKNKLSPVSSLREASVVITENRLSPVVSKGEAADNTNENRTSQLQSQDKATVLFSRMAEKKQSGLAPSVDEAAAGTSEKNRLSLVPSQSEAAINTTEEKTLSPVPSQDEVLFGIDEKNESGRVPSVDKVVVGTAEENKLAPVLLQGEAAFGTAEKHESGRVPSVDEAVVGIMENITLSPVPSQGEVVDGTAEKNESGPSVDEIAVGTAEKNDLDPVPSKGEADVGITENSTLSPVPSQGEVVGTAEKNESGLVLSVDEASVGTTEKNRLGPVVSHGEVVVGTEKNESSLLMDEAAVRTTENTTFSPAPSYGQVVVLMAEKIESNRIPSVDEASVGTTEENKLSPVPSKGETAVDTASNESGRAAVGKNRLSPVLSQGEDTIDTEDSTLGPVPSPGEVSVGTPEERLSPVPSHGESTGGAAEKYDYSGVPSVDGASVGSTLKNSLSPISSQAEAAVDITEEIFVSLFPSQGEAAVGRTEKGRSNRVSSVAVASATRFESGRVLPLDGSGIPKRVPTIPRNTDLATTEKIVLCQSDETPITKTDTHKRLTSRCVQTVAMVDASVDTTELFPFPPLHTGNSAVDKTEKNGSMTKECFSTLPLCDTAVDTSELDTKICNPSSGVSTEDAPLLNLTRPVTRRQRLNSERSSCESTTKASVRNSIEPIKYNPDVNKSPFVQRSYSVNVPPKPIKIESPGPKKQSLILIRRDYGVPQSLSSSHCCSIQDKNSRKRWEDNSRAERYNPPTRTSEEGKVTMNPDLTSDDVFDILFGQKKRRDDPLRNDDTESPRSGQSRKRKNRDMDSETRLLSESSDGSITTTGGSAVHLSTPDVFDVVCGKKSRGFRHDSRNRSPIPVNAVSPRPRKRPHSPVISLPGERAASPTRTLKKRRMSTKSFEDNFDEETRISVSSLSLNEGGSTMGYKKRSAPKRNRRTSSYLDETTNSSTESRFYFEREKKPYATRSSRSAPKRYSPTPFYDAYYYYDHKDQYTGKKFSDTGNKSESENNRKVRRMSVKSVCRDSLKVVDDDDDSHWGKFHGANCTKQCASLTIIRDTPVPRNIDDKFRAQKTAPPEVSVADSKIPDAGNGAWASESIPARTRFGPYEGKIVPAKVFTSYAWLIRKNGKPDRCVDATEPGLSNWMRFVNCARHDGEQNLEAFQCHGNIYYKTTRQVNPHEELLVWYGDEYGRQLGIDPKVCDEEDERSWREKNFKCPGCPFAFASPLYLQSHKRVCRDLKSGAGPSKEPRETSKSKEKTSPVKFRKSNSQSDSLKKVTRCVKSFSGPMQLEPSARTWMKLPPEQSTEDGYFCETCNIHFLRKYHWERHLISKKHGSKEPYACSQCNKTFHIKSSLTRHMKVHTGEMPYACPKCNRRFSEKGNFTKHMDTHIGKKYFVCSECKMKFSEKGSLTKHYYSKHTKTGRKLACSICKKRYCDKQSLRRHQMIHNGEKPFACFVCNKRFSRREVLKTHLKVHSIGAD